MDIILPIKRSLPRLFAKRRQALILAASILLLAPHTVSAAQKYTKQTASNAIIQARLTARSLNPQSAYQLYVIASELSRENFIFEAREICQLLCKSKFADAETYVLLASTYLSVIGDEEKGKPANRYLDKALSLDPKCSAAYYCKARLANQEGRYADALNYADKALSCPNCDLMVLETKASTLESLNRPLEALQSIDAAIKRNPKEPSFYRIKGGILEGQKRYSEAAANYRTSLNLYNIDWAIFRLVHCLECQQKYGEAITELSKLIDKNPKDGEAFRYRALLKIKINDTAGAIRDYDSCISLEPTAKTYKERAKLHLGMGHKDLYKRDLAEAKKLEESPF